MEQLKNNGDLTKKKISEKANDFNRGMKAT